MKKYLVPFFVLLLSVVASLFVVYSISPVDSDVYDISSDTSPLRISPGAGVRQYRYNPDTNTWQYQTTVGGTWYNAPVTTLTDMLNYLGVATTSDIQTAINSVSILSDLDSYFGSPSFPTTLQMVEYGRYDLGSYPINSLVDWMNRYALNSSISNHIQPTWPFLGQTGTAETANFYVSTAAMMNGGMLGLGKLLGGASSFNVSKPYLDSSGSVSSDTGSYLSHLSESIVGLNYNLQKSFQTLSDDIFTFDGTLTPAGIHGPMTTENNSGKPSTNLAEYLGQYLEALQYSSIHSGSLLWQDGSVLENMTGFNYTLSTINAKGFVGLASILRGPTDENGDPSQHTYSSVNYEDLSTSEVDVNDILTAILLPLQDIQNDLAKYMYSHGTDLDIKERENMNPQAEQFVDDFTGADGQGTPTTGQISDTAGVSGGIKDAFSGSSSPADAFSQITDSDNYSFLSSQTQSELNPFYSSRSRSSDIVDFVNPKLDEIRTGVGSSW